MTTQQAAKAAYGYLCEMGDVGHADHPLAAIGSSKDCLLCEAMMILRAAVEGGDSIMFCPQCGTECNRVHWQTESGEKRPREREWDCPNKECGYAWVETQNPRTFRSIV